MQGLPFVNPALRVEAIAFQPWKHYWLGVLLTPWSMNLLLSPRDHASWRPLAQGEKRRYTFPAGTFDVIGASAEAFGEYLMCSLFSPVLEFADQDTARQVATMARAALFDPANVETAAPAGASLSPGTAPATDAAPRRIAQLEASFAAPVSRRDLLHGHFPVNEA
jgi:[NiFe] hydrogenase assembly HybE family chaperone